MNESQEVSEAVNILNQGGIIIFPTDTAFGIGCRLDMPESIDRLFQIKQRSRLQATPVLVNSSEMAKKYFSNPNALVDRFMKKYWPGALTIVSACETGLVYSPVRGDGDTVGLRMPNHTIVLQIITRLGVPILGPSANFHGLPTPYTQTDLDPEFVKKVDYVVKGSCSVGKASTVVDCSIDPYRIIRQGAIVLPFE